VRPADSESDPEIAAQRLRTWRETRDEEAFIQAWLTLPYVPESVLLNAGIFHETTSLSLSRARCLFSILSCTPVETRSAALGAVDEVVRGVESHLWAFLQAGKLVLDSVAREINLVFWHLDGGGRYFEHPAKARWTSFYTVRKKLLSHSGFRDDRVIRVLGERTMGDAADAPYRALSHLANASLVSPLVIGPVSSLCGPTAGRIPLAQCRVLIPDDPREEPLTYAHGLEINRTGGEILTWLEDFLDVICGALAHSLSNRS
jgi:hypothetical protein